MKTPKFEASQYEDSFPDAGREEMERRFSERRRLFLSIYIREQARRSLLRYVKAAQEYENYGYKPAASSGPASQFLGGSVSKKPLRKGELPECHLLGFIDSRGTVGCMAHPLAETSQNYDGRDQAGFFQNTGCCGRVGCEASEEFKFLSERAVMVFDKVVDGMSWYEYSRHATSVLVHYLKSYDHIVRRLHERMLPGALSLEQLVGFTNSLYDEWPFRASGRSGRRLPDAHSAEVPVDERALHLALGTCFLEDDFAMQLTQARDYVESRIADHQWQLG